MNIYERNVIVAVSSVALFGEEAISREYLLHLVLHAAKKAQDWFST
jgi:hypothetical protein